MQERAINIIRTLLQSIRIELLTILRYTHKLESILFSNIANGIMFLTPQIIIVIIH